MYVYGHISLSSSQNEKYYRWSCRENQNTHFVFNKGVSPLPPENGTDYEIILKNVVVSGGSQITIMLRKKCAVCMPGNENKNTDALL